ncbi:hypothetical protein HYW76_03775 [Candidatus Pacearchaeota archaeon]|nr:hypothetical protein [Candidatus Pacearchaeota archaeon]
MRKGGYLVLLLIFMVQNINAETIIGTIDGNKTIFPFYNEELSISSLNQNDGNIQVLLSNWQVSNLKINPENLSINFSDWSNHGIPSQFMEVEADFNYSLRDINNLYSANSINNKGNLFIRFLENSHLRLACYLYQSNQYERTLSARMNSMFGGQGFRFIDNDGLVYYGYISGVRETGIDMVCRPAIHYISNFEAISVNQKKRFSGSLFLTLSSDSFDNQTINSADLRVDGFIEDYEKRDLDILEQIDEIKEDISQLENTNYTCTSSCDNQSTNSRYEFYIQYLSYSDRKNMVCGYGKETHAYNIIDLGVNCTILYPLRNKYNSTSRTYYQVEVPSCSCREIKV